MSQRDERIIRQEMRERVKGLWRFMEGQIPRDSNTESYKNGYLRALGDVLEIL